MLRLSPAAARTLIAMVGTLLALLFVLVWAAPANAHDVLVDATPRADTTVTTELTEAKLTFNNPALTLGGDRPSSIIEVTDAAGLHYERGCAVNQNRDVSVPVALGAAGKYTLSYQVVSSDGHTISDSWTFDYEPPAGATTTPGTASLGCAALASAKPDDVSAPQDNLADEQADGNQLPGEFWLVLGIGGIVVILVAIGVTVAYRSTRK